MPLLASNAVAPAVASSPNMVIVFPAPEVSIPSPPTISSVFAIGIAEPTSATNNVAI